MPEVFGEAPFGLLGGTTTAPPSGSGGTLEMFGGAAFGALAGGTTTVTPPAPSGAGGTLAALPRTGASGGIIDFGETYTSDQLEVRDIDGVLGAADVTVTITLPDGVTVVDVTPTSTTTGRYVFDWTPTGSGRQAGLHRVVATATGGVLGSVVRTWVSSYDVDSETPLVPVRAVLAQPWARGIATDPATLEHLRWLCLLATDAVGRDLGRAPTRRTVVERHSGGRAALVLKVTPVVSVTSVVESGQALTGGADVDWVLDEPGTGILWRGSPTSGGRWAAGRQNVTVTYIAGYVTPPPVLRSVALGVVQQAWQAAAQVPRGSFDQTLTDASVFAAAGALSPPERASYNALRAVAIA